jgi:hypothetical protein
LLTGKWADRRGTDRKGKQPDSTKSPKIHFSVKANPFPLNGTSCQFNH